MKCYRGMDVWCIFSSSSESSIVSFTIITGETNLADRFIVEVRRWPTILSGGKKDLRVEKRNDEGEETTNDHFFGATQNRCLGLGLGGARTSCEAPPHPG